MGLAHSAWVGLFELLTGLLLLIGSADISFRGVAGGIGVILFIAGIVVAAGTGEILLRIGTERATGWFAAVLGAIAVAASLLPTFLRSDRMVESDRGVG
jgi:membrane-bound ClpP family serine protease